MDACSKPVCLISRKKRSQDLSLSEHGYMQWACLSHPKAVKRTPPSWQLLLPPASVAASPASPSRRCRSREPVCLISSEPVCLISRNKRSQDLSLSTSSSPWVMSELDYLATRHSKKIRWECSQGLYPLSRQLFVSSQWQSLSTTSFFPMTNHSELSHITQQHNNKQNTQTFAFLTFHSQNISKVINTSNCHRFPSGASLISNSSCYYRDTKAFFFDPSQWSCGKWLFKVWTCVRCTVSHPTLNRGGRKVTWASIRAAAPMSMAVQFSAVKLSFALARGYLVASSTIFLLLEYHTYN
jgi:hypothetical protein